MLQLSNPIGAEIGLEPGISQSIWAQKYQYKSGDAVIDHTVMDTWMRVANGLAACEPMAERGAVAQQFYNAMSNFKLIPAGRILAGCGTARNVTLSNTFVMQTLPDSVEGIMDTAKEAALTMKMGGGLGYDFSTIRPKGMNVAGLDCPAAGPIAAMEIFDAVCAMVVTGMGRGAMMATLRCDHPDVIDFVNAKTEGRRLKNFNMSVMVTDAFMAAVEKGDPWDLVWDGRVVQKIGARTLWHLIIKRTYQSAEPGVLFIDRINATNPLNYLETISATNSCAEQPLPPNGTCPLASINLAKLIADPFTPQARMDYDMLRTLSAEAVHLLDNALETSLFANDAQRREAHSKRRVGIGVTAVANALFMLDLRYGSAEAAAELNRWMREIQNAAYGASAELAALRGPFPAYDATKHQEQACVAKLDPNVRQKIMRYGLRNGTLTSVAPTGTISMLAGNVSSGIEPVFSRAFSRKITNADGSTRKELVEDYGLRQFRQKFGASAELPASYVTAMDLTPEAHVAMQAAAQEWVDAGISKTVNCPEDIPFDAFQNIYRTAYDAGCKGCTTFRPNPNTGSVLSME